MRLQDVLEKLFSDNTRHRERALREVARRGRVGVSPAEGIQLLKASTLPYPPRRDPDSDTGMDLLRAALRVPYPEYLPHLVGRFHLWQPRARREVLSLLAKVDDPRAAAAVVEIVRAHARTGLVDRLPLGMYATNPQSAELFFPALLDCLTLPKLVFPVVQWTLSFAAAHLIDQAILVPHAETFLAAYRRRRDWLEVRQHADGVAWRWERRYHGRRWQAGVLLDLLGYLPAEVAEPELRRALATYTDPRLQLGAVLSLLRLNADVDADTVAAVAACPESRQWLFDGLQKGERFHLYPHDLKGQEHLAESNLIDWLIDGRELGCAPETIELVETLTFESGTDAGPLEYYLFRFRAPAGHWAATRGWMAGVAGPYVHRETPTILAHGDTGSALIPWDHKSLPEHLDDVARLADAWRERHVATED